MDRKALVIFLNDDATEEMIKQILTVIQMIKGIEGVEPFFEDYNTSLCDKGDELMCHAELMALLAKRRANFKGKTLKNLTA